MSAAHDWTEAAVAPLRERDAELGLAARHELATSGKGLDEETKAILTRRFRAIDRRAPRRRRLVSRSLFVLAVLLSVGMVAEVILRLGRQYSFISSITMMSGATADPQSKLASQLSDEERLFVYGDPSLPPESAAHALWQSRPNDARLFQDYLGKRDPLPADLLETAAEVDPENGWYHLLRAGELAEGAVEKTRRPGGGSRSKRTQLSDWAVVDQQAYEEACVLVNEALKKPSIRSHAIALLQERLRILPEERDLNGRIGRIMFSVGAETRSVFKILRVSDLLATQAYLAGEEGDAESLARLIPAAWDYSWALAEQEGTLVQQLVVLASAIIVHNHLAEACGKAGMPEEEKRLNDLVAEMASIREQDPEPGYDELKLRAGMLAAMALPVVDTLGLPAPSEESMRASRMVDYALVDQLSVAGSAAALLLASALLGLFLLSRGKLARALGFRFEQLLGVRDYCWIYLLGVVAPVALYVVIVMLTPLGGRDWSLMARLTLPNSIQLAATIALIMLAASVVTRWRLRCHLGGLAPLPWSSKRGLVLVLLLVLTIALAGLLPSMAGPLVFSGMVVPALVCLAVIDWRALSRQPGSVPSRCAEARALLAVFAGAALLMVLLYPLTRWAERYWISRDAMMATTPENYGFSLYERKSADLIQSKLLAVLKRDGGE